MVQLALDPRHRDHPRAARPGEARIPGARSIPTVVTVADDPGVARPLDPGRTSDRSCAGLLMPPPDEQEQRFLKGSSRERARRFGPG